MVQLQKSELRQQLLQFRQSLTEDEIKQKSLIICRQVGELESFQNAQHVLIYHPHKNEVNLLPLIHQFPEKTWYLPKLKGQNEFIALPFQPNDGLQKNQYGILEPTEKTDERFEGQLNLILVPGLGFDRKGNRLGMGKGYYDRYLKKVQEVFKIGVCFGKQMVDQIPVDSYDVSVDLVIHD